MKLSVITRFKVIIIIGMLFTNNLMAKDGSNKSKVYITLPEVAMLGLSGSNSIVLEPKAPAEAGLEVDFSQATNSEIWLNYSSIVSRYKRRRVTAAITSGKVPKGLKLKVLASADIGKGDGNVGYPAHQINLNKVDKTIIRNIRSCYTGYGVNRGHKLTYYLEIQRRRYKKLIANKSTITITYTLTD